MRLLKLTFLLTSTTVPRTRLLFCATRPRGRARQGDATAGPARECGRGAVFQAFLSFIDCRWPEE